MSPIFIYPSQYYEDLKKHARQIRVKFNLLTPRIMKSDMKRIFKHYGIHFDLWPYKFKTIRGAYINDALGPTIMVAQHLPLEPTIFTMAHELKHFLRDSHEDSFCAVKPVNKQIEIGAEVFAAEFIFPDEDFLIALKNAGVKTGECTAEDIVRLKETSKTTLSYTALSKKANFLGYSKPETYLKVKWIALRDKILGEPIYKKFNRWRKNKY